MTVTLDEFNPARLGAWTYDDAKAVLDAEPGE